MIGQASIPIPGLGAFIGGLISGLISKIIFEWEDVKRLFWNACNAIRRVVVRVAKVVACAVKQIASAIASFFSWFS